MPIAQSGRLERADCAIGLARQQPLTAGGTRGGLPADRRRGALPAGSRSV